MLDRENGVTTRKIDLNIIRKQLEVLRAGKTNKEKDLIIQLLSEVISLDDQLKAMFRQTSGLLSSDAKLSYPEVEEQFSREFEAFAKQLNVLAERMIEGKYFDSEIGETVRIALQEKGRDLQLLAIHKPSFKYSPEALQLKVLCEYLGGYCINVGQDMHVFGVVEKTITKNGAAKVKIEGNAGECAGIQHKWACEIVATGMARYPIAASMAVFQHQSRQIDIQNNQYSEIARHTFKDINTKAMLEKLQTGVPHLFALREPQKTGHALGLRRHAGFIEIVDPNFGYFFFPDIAKAAVWLNTLFRIYQAMDFPCSELQLMAYTATDNYLHIPCAYPTNRDVEINSARPHTEKGYEEMVQALKAHFIDVLNNADQEKLAVIMMKAFNDYADCVSGVEIRKLQLVIESLIKEDGSLDETLIAEFCGTSENYNKLKSAFKTFIGQTGGLACINLLESCKSYKDPVQLIPKPICQFMEEVEHVLKSLSMELNALRLEKSEAEERRENEKVKELDYKIKILGMKQTQLLKAAIVPNLKAEFARDRKCDLDKAVARFKEQVGTALNIKELQPHLKELMAIDAAKGRLTRYCQRFEDKYKEKETLWFVAPSIGSQVSSAYERAINEIRYDLAKSKIAELEQYEQTILATAARDAKQSIRDAKFEDILRGDSADAFLDTAVHKRCKVDRETAERNAMLESIAAINLNPCIEKLEALNTDADKRNDARFKNALGCLLALQKEQVYAVNGMATKDCSLADFQNVLKSIMQDIDALEKPVIAQRHKPRVMVTVRPIARVDSMTEADAVVEDTADTLDSDNEKIVIKERPFVETESRSMSNATAAEPVKPDSGLCEISVRDLDDLDKMGDDLLNQSADIAIASLTAYKASLMTSLTEKEKSLNRDHDIRRRVIASRALDIIAIKAELAQRKIDEIRSMQQQAVAANTAADEINLLDRGDSVMDGYFESQLDKRSNSQFQNVENRADSIYGFLSRADHAEIEIRELYAAAKDEQKKHGLFKQSLDSTKALRQDLLFAAHGLYQGEKLIPNFEKRLSGIKSDIDRIKSIIAAQQEKDAAAERVRNAVKAPVSSQPEVEIDPALKAKQDEFIEELTKLRNNIETNNHKIGAGNENLANAKVKVIDRLITRVKGNKRQDLSDVIGTFLNDSSMAEFRPGIPGYNKGKPIQIQRVKNSNILYAHRRTGMLSIFNLFYKTDTQKLLEKYSSPQAIESRKRNRV